MGAQLSPQDRPTVRLPGEPQAAAPDFGSARAEVDALTLELSARESIRALTWAVVAGFVGFVLLLMAIKLVLDSTSAVELMAVAATADLAVWLVVAASVVRGRRLLRIERAKFERLRQVRRALGIDLPARQFKAH